MKKIASKLEVISFSPNKIIFRGNFVRGIDCTQRKIQKKFFGGQKPPKIILLGLKLTTPNFDAFFSIFWPPENFFRIFRCAQSIPRTKLPIKMILLGLKLITLKFDAFFSIFWPPKNFFRIFRCAQSISRARKPPSTKNQPILRKKFFRPTGAREIHPPFK